MSKVINRKGKELTDAEKFKALQLYSEGVETSEIATAVSRDTTTVSRFIKTQIDSLNTVRETKIMAAGCTANQLQLRGKNPTKYMTQDFLDKVEENADIYAYYYVQTGDNKFSLESAGLNGSINRNLPKATKDYVYRIRGQFIRQLPGIASLIKQEQDRVMEQLDVQKPHVQRELLNQIEELKILCVDDPRQRTNLLKAIEMLGKTVTAFTDSVRMEEANAKSGLEILMEKVKKEEGTVYESSEQEATSED